MQQTDSIGRWINRKGREKERERASERASKKQMEEKLSQTRNKTSSYIRNIHINGFVYKKVPMIHRNKHKY